MTMEEFSQGNSRCSKLFFSSLFALIVIVLLDCYVSLLPFSGIYLFLYLLLVSVISMWSTFVLIQKLLKNNKPLQYKYNNNQFLKILKKMPKMKLEDWKYSEIQQETLKDLEERIQDFANDLETYFIAKWYRNITCDQTFNTESHKLIKDTTRRFLQVAVMLDGKKLLHGILLLFLKHLKEYRKTVRRSKKNGVSIEDSYRYFHISSKSENAQEHFTQKLTTNVLRQFINWELWNSLPCRTLVSVLSWKFTNYMLIYISKPGFLNYRILKSIASEEIQKKLKLNDYSFISLSGCRNLEKTIENIETVHFEHKSIIDLIDGANTPKETPKKIPINKTNADTVDEFDGPKKSKYDEKSESFGEEAVEYVKGKAVSEPVKIYESKSSDRTWRNSSDLECISLGQDMLSNLQDGSDPESHIPSFIEKKLWRDATDPLLEADNKQNATFLTEIQEFTKEDLLPTVETTRVSPPSSIPSFLRPSTTGAATLITNTIKPIGSVTASIFPQSTVDTVNNVVKPVSQATSNAMHKIGDLQDEAAGVMEGIFDFGLAGIRKGLRLTGLQDNLSEAPHKTKIDSQKFTPSKKIFDTAKVSEQKQSETIKPTFEKMTKRLPKWPQIVADDPKLDEIEASDESVWINPLTKDSPNFDGQILLERTPIEQSKSFSTDTESVSISETESKQKSYDIPQISTDSEHVDSPEPEYEEPADFASTIAKLRSLLQQKSSESNLTTPAVSPMPQDDSLKTTPVDPSAEAATEIDGVMPSLYKFCARTATGVFQNTLNTIKTALPGNVQEHVQPSLIQDNVDNWTYIASDSSSNDMMAKMERLLCERREFCTVDTAYEAIDSLNIEEQPDEVLLTDSVSAFDDELDDFELQIPVTKALLDIVCELVMDTNTSLVQEAVIKSILLLIGDKSEKYFEEESEKVVHRINTLVGKLPTGLNQETKAMKLEEMIEVCMESLAGIVKQLVGEETLKSSVQLFITSLQYQRINQDLFMQIFELVGYEIIRASNQLTPAFSA